MTSNPVLSDEEIRKVAKARVGVKVHALVYVVVNAFLAGVYFVTRPAGEVAGFQEGAGYYWPIWPLMGWGVGLLIHAFVVYGGGLAWERREEERLRARQGRAP